jgi:hypothetical protein
MGSVFNPFDGSLQIYPFWKIKMYWSVEKLITVHLVIVSGLLLIIAYLLRRCHLFRWSTAGFWAWVAFALYYVLNPLSSLLQKDLYLYQVNLTISGGTERGLWILGVTVMGILAFYFSYFRTPPVKITWNLSVRHLTLSMVIVLVPFLVFGLYSLLAYHASTVEINKELIISSGRFTGQVSGYENIGYMFLFVPTLLLLLADSPYTRVTGWIVAGLFFFLSLPNGWSRYVLVSLLLAVSLADSVRRNSVLPRLWMLPLLLVITVALQQRGHAQWTLATAGNELLGLASSSFENVGKAISGQDTAMLANWYLESYTKDTITGYDYGLPVINYLATGWIPNPLFPQKYFLVDWLRTRQPSVPVYIEEILYGTKSTLLGGFYDEGGMVAVVLLAALVGYLSRKLDGMLSQDSPLLVQAVGVAWISVLWMVWGSSDSWGVMTLGTLVLPSLVVWLVAPKKHYLLGQSANCV